MQVTCTGARQGLDGQPSMLNAKETGEISTPACGKVYDFDPEFWYTTEEQVNGLEAVVTAEHRQATCPFCGTGTFVVKEG